MSNPFDKPGSVVHRSEPGRHLSRALIAQGLVRPTQSPGFPLSGRLGLSRDLFGLSSRRDCRVSPLRQKKQRRTRLCGSNPPTKKLVGVGITHYAAR